LDINFIAMVMGKAFALMHWGAGITADDVEFVLGSHTTNLPGDEGDNFQQRAIGLYLLDFGQCEHVDLAEDAEDVYQAFKGAMVTGDNQLFIPNCQKI
jgi:hypothetical protein